jgi:hypothetical protein
VFRTSINTAQKRLINRSFLTHFVVFFKAVEELEASSSDARWNSAHLTLISSIPKRRKIFIQSNLCLSLLETTPITSSLSITRNLCMCMEMEWELRLRPNLSVPIIDVNWEVPRLKAREESVGEV